MERFWDEENGGFFSTPKDSDELPVRPKELYDGAIPSANSIALSNLVFLFRLTGDPQWEKRAQAQIRAFAGTVKSQPQAFTYFLCALDFALRPGQDIITDGLQVIEGQATAHVCRNGSCTDSTTDTQTMGDKIMEK